MAKGREGNRGEPDKDDRGRQYGQSTGEATSEAEESLNEYYYRVAGQPNRNEVIPTWKKLPPDRNAEPEAFDFDAGVYGPKDQWGKTQTFEEAQRELDGSGGRAIKHQKDADPGRVPSSMRRTGKRAP